MAAVLGAFGDALSYYANTGSYGTANKIMLVIESKLRESLLTGEGRHASTISFQNRVPNQTLLAKCLSSAANYQKYKALTPEQKKGFREHIAKSLQEIIVESVQASPSTVTLTRGYFHGHVIEIAVLPFQEITVNQIVKSAAEVYGIPAEIDLTISNPFSGEGGELESSRGSTRVVFDSLPDGAAQVPGGASTHFDGISGGAAQVPSYPPTVFHSLPDGAAQVAGGASTDFDGISDGAAQVAGYPPTGFDSSPGGAAQVPGYPPTGFDSFPGRAAQVPGYFTNLFDGISDEEL